MNPKLWWYVARASGMTAAVLVTLAVIWGLLLSTRLVRGRATPAWLLDLHRFLGGLSVIFTGIHLAGLVADNYLHFDLVDLIVPMASSWKPGAVAWGVVALYLLVAVEITSLAIRRLPRPFWRRVHRTSYLLFWMVVVHGFLAGTDHANPIYLAGTALAAGVVVFLTSFLVLGGRQRTSSRRASRVAPPAPTFDRERSPAVKPCP